VIGLFTGKGDIIQFTKNGKKCNYIVLELDDMKLGKGKIRCTFWEDFATKLVNHMEEQPTSLSSTSLKMQWAYQIPIIIQFSTSMWTSKRLRIFAR
ncbi:hypothetical protein S83_051637, partial [Arachis hypogaea]